MADKLLTRSCAGCGQVDTDPRHVVAMPDQSEVPWHLDCHANVSAGYWGPGPCPSCTSQLEGFNGQGGKALRSHIVGGN